MKWKIPLFKTYSDERDVEAVSEIVKRGTFWADGPEIKEFEKKLAEFMGTKYAVVFNSGTSASHAQLLAHKIKGEVIVPSFSFISTANCVLMVGAKPVFADIEEETLGLDYEDVKNKLSDKTQAVMIVHYGGMPARDTLKIKKLCEGKSILFLEDAAEAMGSFIDGKKAGSISDSSMISFCQNKIISTGEGGAILTNSEEIYENLKSIRSHGRHSADYFTSSNSGDYAELGYNFRMPTMNAALGLSQLNKIDKLITMRKKCAEYYNKELGTNKNITLLDSKNSVYQLYSVLLKDEETRTRMIESLNNVNVMAKIYFEPIHLTKFYRDMGHKEGELPVTEKIAKQILSLPIYPGMSEEELNYVVSHIGG